MFWKRIITSLMFGLGLAMVLRSLINIIPWYREKKKNKRSHDDE